MPYESLLNGSRMKHLESFACAKRTSESMFPSLNSPIHILLGNGFSLGQNPDLNQTQIRAAVEEYLPKAKSILEATKSSSIEGAMGGVARAIKKDGGR